MNLAYMTYHLLGRLLFPVLYLAFRLHSTVTRGNWEETKQRFGRYSPALMERLSGSPRIWIHGASVGEISVAEAIVASLKASLPNASIVVSTATKHGRDHGSARLSPQTPCIFAPLDLPAAVNNALASIGPDILVCLETEIWPNWLVSAHHRGIKTAIVNGRISIRSIGRYLKIKSMLKETLQGIDRFSMIDESDADRLRMLGAPGCRISIGGNAKYDLLLEKSNPHLKQEMAEAFGLRGDESVFLAGSTREKEEEIVLDVYRKVIAAIPDALLIIAPRHISRTPRIEALVRERGFDYQLKTDLDKPGGRRAERIVIVNTIGQLQAIYSIGTVVFCGGSMVPLGGQNVMEAAVWGKPVLYGSSMDDFMDAKDRLERTGGGMTVEDGQALGEKVVYYLSHPEEARRMGSKAKEAVMSNRGAAQKHAAVILDLMKEDS